MPPKGSSKKNLAIVLDSPQRRRSARLSAKEHPESPSTPKPRREPPTPTQKRPNKKGAGEPQVISPRYDTSPATPGMRQLVRKDYMKSPSSMGGFSTPTSSDRSCSPPVQRPTTDPNFSTPTVASFVIEGPPSPYKAHLPAYYRGYQTVTTESHYPAVAWDYKAPAPPAIGAPGQPTLNSYYRRQTSEASEPRSSKSRELSWDDATARNEVELKASYEANFRRQNQGQYLLPPMDLSAGPGYTGYGFNRSRSHTAHDGPPYDH